MNGIMVMHLSSVEVSTQRALELKVQASWDGVGVERMGSLHRYAGVHRMAQKFWVGKMVHDAHSVCHICM